MRWLFVLLAACGSSKDAPPAPAPSPAAAVKAAAIPPEVELPEVEPTGYRSAPSPRVRITMTPSALAIDGTQVLTLDKGAIADADLPKLTAAAKPLAALQETIGSVQVFHDRPQAAVLAIDHRVTVGTLVRAIDAVKQAGVDRFTLVARTKGGTVVAPIPMPQAPVADALEIAVTPGHIKIRDKSLDGAHVDAAALTSALGGASHVVISLDRAVTIQQLAEVLGAVRATVTDVVIVIA